MRFLKLKKKPKRVESPPVPSRPCWNPATGLLDEAVVREWLIAKLARVVGIPMSDVDPALNFVEYGLDSMQAIRLSGDLERWMGFELPPILLYDYPSIDTLARYLAENPPVPAAH
jgi:acyl carrier protein